MSENNWLHNNMPTNFQRHTSPMTSPRPSRSMSPLSPLPSTQVPPSGGTTSTTSSTTITSATTTTTNTTTTLPLTTAEFDSDVLRNILNGIARPESQGQIHSMNSVFSSEL